MLTVARNFIVWLSVVFLAGVDRSRAGAPSPEIDPSSIIEKIDVARNGVGHLSIPVSIHNKKYLFILDTGSARVLYDTSFRAILGKPKKTEKANTDAGNIELATFDAPKASLGKIDLNMASGVVVSDLSNLRNWSGVDYYGIIGMNFLINHVIRIDFDKGEVLFLKSLCCKPGRALPLSFHHGVIYTNTSIPGCNRKESFLIDTGADRNDSGTVSSDYYNRLFRNHFAKPFSSGQRSLTLSGLTEKNTAFRLNGFSLGGFSHRNLIFATSRKRDNMLGLGYLSRYIVTFDFPNRVMYLKKGKMYDLPDGEDRSGLSMARHSGKTVVTKIESLSPAWWKGIQRGDEILKIDGYSANHASLYSLRRLLGMEGKKVDLVLQRGQERIEVCLKLK